MASFARPPPLAPPLLPPRRSDARGPRRRFGEAQPAGHRRRPPSSAASTMLSLRAVLPPLLLLLSPGPLGPGAAADQQLQCKPVSSLLCPEVVYPTTAQNVSLTDSLMETQANRISSSGFDKSGKDCHNALRMTLCYLAYPRCDPTTGHLPPVCDSMRRSALLACTPALGEFRDKSVILAELPEERFSDNSIDCYPDNNPVPENPVVGGEILPDDEVANNTGVELTPAPDAVALASNDSDNAENKVRPAAGPPPGALTPSAVTVTVTEPLSPFTVPPDIGGISPAVDPTTNTSSASIGIPSTSKNSITPGNTTQAVTTGTGSGERICSNSDLIFFYGDCLANGTRTIECSLRPDVQCKDVWMLTKKVHVEQCACQNTTVASFLTPCSANGVRSRIWYYSILDSLPLGWNGTVKRPWPCDRRRDVPAVESGLSCNSSDTSHSSAWSDARIAQRLHELHFAKHVDAHNVTAPGNLRTGVASIRCARPPFWESVHHVDEVGRNSTKCGEELRTQEYQGWTPIGTDVAVQSDAVSYTDWGLYEGFPGGVFAFLEITVAPDAGATDPAILFAFTSNSAPHYYGMRFLLNGRLAMRTTTNQTDTIGYAAPLEKGGPQVARWEYVAGNRGWSQREGAGTDRDAAVINGIYLRGARLIGDEVPAQATEPPANKSQQAVAPTPSATPTGPDVAGQPASLTPLAVALVVSVGAVGVLAYAFRVRNRRRRFAAGSPVSSSDPPTTGGGLLRSTGVRRFSLFARGGANAYEPVGRDGRRENMEMESFDIFGDSDGEFADDADDDNAAARDANHGGGGQLAATAWSTARRSASPRTPTSERFQDVDIHAGDDDNGHEFERRPASVQKSPSLNR